MLRSLTLAIALAIAGPAFAWGTFGNPGGYQAPEPHWPTTINPNGMGGYTIQQPGHWNTQVNPNGMGGYTIQQPGHWTTNCNPNGMGGLRCN